MGPKTSLIAVDVLRKPVGVAPIDQGRRLYLGLAQSGRVVLTSDSANQEHIPDWLELHGFVVHDFIQWGPVLNVANYQRREGYDIDMVVVANPVDAQELIRAGFNTLLFTHSQYSVPEWRPDAPKGVRPWEDITQQVADLAKMKAQDARLRDDD